MEGAGFLVFNLTASQPRLNKIFCASDCLFKQAALRSTEGAKKLIKNRRPDKFNFGRRPKTKHKTPTTKHKTIYCKKPFRSISVELRPKPYGENLFYHGILKNQRKE